MYVCPWGEVPCNVGILLCSFSPQTTDGKWHRVGVFCPVYAFRRFPWWSVDIRGDTTHEIENYLQWCVKGEWLGSHSVQFCKGHFFLSIFQKHWSKWGDLFWLPCFLLHFENMSWFLYMTQKYNSKCIFLSSTSSIQKNSWRVLIETTSQLNFGTVQAASTWFFMSQFNHVCKIMLQLFSSYISSKSPYLCYCSYYLFS